MSLQTDAMKNAVKNIGKWAVRLAGVFCAAHLLVSPTAAQQGSGSTDVQRPSRMEQLRLPSPLPGLQRVHPYPQTRPLRLQRPRGPSPPASRRRQNRRNFLERLRTLLPEEQERILANDRRFRNLTPEQQEEIRRRLKRWNRVPPDERRRMRQRQRVLGGLSPAQRRHVRSLFDQWRSLPPERRQLLVQSFRRLRSLPPDKRREFLEGPELEGRLTPQERRTLAGLARLLPPPGNLRMRRPRRRSREPAPQDP